LSGWGVAVRHKTFGAGYIQKLLRELDTPVLTGAREDEIILHVRTLQEGDEQIIIHELAGVLNA
ncbi:MAG: L-seryl-tRNA(Sec) selenium transferase, partial [Synergistaceae bacterium]|nr:L-seryl-tRNA(Sec) selenium transferase [Synergistaceae bacterium]